jgi:hypothetical protein
MSFPALSTFFVEQVIIHRVPKSRIAEKDATDLYLSEVPSELDTDRKNYFRKRIIGSLGKEPFRVTYDAELESPVPQLLLDYFVGDGASFVDTSHHLARHLYVAQTGSNSGGLLAVIDGVIGSGKRQGKCLVLLKLEMEQGIDFVETNVGGKATMEIGLRNVTLTDKTRVFKAALFPRFGTLAKLAASVSDQQLSAGGAASEVSEFFLRRFLGCQFTQTADRQTKEFFDYAEEWINTELTDPAERARAELGLLSEMNSNNQTIDPTTYASAYIPIEHQDGFRNRLRLDDGSVAMIPKETSLIRPRIDINTIHYANGLRLVGQLETFDAVDVGSSETVIRQDVAAVEGGSRTRPRSTKRAKRPNEPD